MKEEYRFPTNKVLSILCTINYLLLIYSVVENVSSIIFFLTFRS